MIRKRFSFSLIFAFVVILTMQQAKAQNSPFPYSNSRSKMIDSVMIHYRIWEPSGSKEKGKVVFVHGFCGSTFNFRYNIDSVVAAGYEVVALDLPGFGYSGRNDKVNQSQSNRSRLIWMLLDSISAGDTTPWNLVGHSMGGGTVEAMAIMHPEKTKTLTIVDGMLISKSSAFYQSFFSLSRSHKRDEVLENITKKKLITYRNLEKKLKSVYGFEPDSALVNAYLIPMEIPGSSATVVNIITNSEEIATLDRDVLVGTPILVIWGKKDNTIGLRNGKRFKREITSVDLHVIDDAYHMPMETQPLIFNKILITFLNSRNL